jgi:hypothetical protein
MDEYTHEDQDKYDECLKLLEENFGPPDSQGVIYMSLDLVIECRDIWSLVRK